MDRKLSNVSFHRLGKNKVQGQNMTYSCPKCKKSYDKPVKLDILTKGARAQYDACPHCFSSAVKQPLRFEDEEEPEPETKTETETETVDTDLKEDTEDTFEERDRTVEKVEGDKPSSCTHYVGYLKVRPKGTPIPDECLICSSIVDCM